MTEGVVIFSSR